MMFKSRPTQKLNCCRTGKGAPKTDIAVWKGISDPEGRGGARETDLRVGRDLRTSPDALTHVSLVIARYLGVAAGPVPWTP